MGSCLAMILVIVQRIGSMLYANYPHRLRFFDWVTPPQKCSSNRALGVVERACAEINPIPTKKKGNGANPAHQLESIPRTCLTHDNDWSTGCFQAHPTRRGFYVYLSSPKHSLHEVPLWDNFCPP